MPLHRVALDALIPVLYEELHRIAARQLGAERPGHTLRPTDLVSEAYLRLSSSHDLSWGDRHHFLALAAKAMRQILVDHARRRQSEKRGGGAAAVTFNDELVGRQDPHEVLALDQALQALEEIDDRKARVVELKHFGGLSHDEIAAVLEVHVATVARDLRFAEAWIHARLQESR